MITLTHGDGFDFTFDPLDVILIETLLEACGDDPAYYCVSLVEGVKFRIKTHINLHKEIRDARLKLLCDEEVSTQS